MTSHSSSFFKCGRWDLNPHERNAHKILSLARLPVPTLPRTSRHECYNIICAEISQYLFLFFLPDACLTLFHLSETLFPDLCLRMVFKISLFSSYFSLCLCSCAAFFNSSNASLKRAERIPGLPLIRFLW